MTYVTINNNKKNYCNDSIVLLFIYLFIIILDGRMPNKKYTKKMINVTHNSKIISY